MIKRRTNTTVPVLIEQLLRGFSRIFLAVKSVNLFCRRQSPTSYLSSRCAISFCPFWGAGWESVQLVAVVKEVDENMHCSCWLATTAISDCVIVFFGGVGHFYGSCTPIQEALPSLHLPQNVTMIWLGACYFQEPPLLFYHLESRWRNSHVLVYHGPLQIATFWEYAPSTFTRVYMNRL